TKIISPSTSQGLSHRQARSIRASQILGTDNEPHFDGRLALCRVMKHERDWADISFLIRSGHARILQSRQRTFTKAARKAPSFEGGDMSASREARLKRSRLLFNVLAKH